MKLFDFFKKKLKKYDDEVNFTCDICGREVFDGARVCHPCLKLLPWNDKNICPFCGRKVLEEGVCLECKQQPLKVKKARSALLYEGDAARLVLRFKTGEKFLFRTFAELSMSAIEREFPMCNAVTFIPMTRKAERKRGYNQSRLFAEEIAARTGKELLSVAEKRRETGAQKFLGRTEREKNLEGAFHITERKAVKDKSILIVDDTLTTGATVSELADALLRAKAKEVYAFTLTSAVNKHPFGLPPLEKAPARPPAID